MPTVYESANQLAARLNINRATLWRWVAAGKLPRPVKFSPGCSRFDVGAVDAALAALAGEHAPKLERAQRAGAVSAERRRARAAAKGE